MKIGGSVGFDQLEVGFGGPTVGAGPRVGNVLEVRARWNAFFWNALSLIVNVSANDAHELARGAGHDRLDPKVTKQLRFWQNWACMEVMAP